MVGENIQEGAKREKRISGANDQCEDTYTIIGKLSAQLGPPPCTSPPARHLLSLHLIRCHDNCQKKHQLSASRLLDRPLQHTLQANCLSLRQSRKQNERISSRGGHSNRSFQRSHTRYHQGEIGRKIRCYPCRDRGFEWYVKCLLCAYCPDWPLVVVVYIIVHHLRHSRVLTLYVL